MVLLDSPAGAVAFAGATGSGLLLMVMASRVPRFVIAHLTAGLLMTVLVTLSVLNGGGLGAPGLFALPVVPVLAFFIGGQRIGLLWLTISAALPVLLYIVDPWLPAPGIDEPGTARLHAIASVVAVMALGVLAWYYDRDVAKNVERLRKARLIAERANDAKSVFLATMSHEIRTPLAGILAAAELLRDTPDGDERTRLLELLQHSGQGLHALVDQILDLSKLEAGALTLESVPMRLTEVVEEAIAMHTPAAAQRDLVLRRQIGEGADAWVLGDPLRVRQVVQNLLSNAVKFTKRGEVVVRVARTTNGYLIEVHDTGIGIDPQSLSHLFKPFRQADEGTARAFGGSGLGLAIVYELVSHMRGRLSVRSKPGQGSCFTVELPLALAPEPPPPQEQHTDYPLELHVLLADDNPVNRAVLVRMLDRLGCSSVVVDSGEAAIEAARTARYDVILMDVHMPGVDGLEATRRILAEGSVPVLALTASRTDDVEAACAAAGMTGFIPKPVSMDRLRATLSSRHWPRATA